MTIRLVPLAAALCCAALPALGQYGPSSSSLLGVPEATLPPAYQPASPVPADAQPRAASGLAPGRTYAQTAFQDPASVPAPGGYSSYGAAYQGGTDANSAEQLWAEPPVPNAQGNFGLGCTSCGSGCGPGGSPFAAALVNNCFDGPPGPCGPCPWFASLGGVVMTRDHANRFWTSFDVNNPENQILNTRQASADWRAGGEVSIGRRFGCNCQWGVVGTFWAIDRMEGFASVRDPNDAINTPIDLGFVNIGANPATDFFDNAREHRIWRTNELYNLEVNLLRYGLTLDPTWRMQAALLAGVRWLRFDERLIFGSVAGGSEFGSNGGANEAYLNIREENNLVGFQLGTVLSYYVLPRLRLYATPVVGIFGNDIRQRVHLYRGDGVEGFDLLSQKTDFSFLGQLDAGLSWQFAEHWRAFGAYRVIGISGIALADEQIPPFLIDAPAIQDIDSNGNLILHGAVFGVQFCY
jgi:hypothetical protein